MEAVSICDDPHLAHVTRVVRCSCLRRVLRRLWEEDGAPKLDDHVPRLGSIRPRTVTASREQIQMLLEKAKPTLHLMLLLCSDLGIRSGTAVRLNPDNYDQRRGELRFKTKYDEKVSTPVTTEIADILDALDLNSRLPFITQLRKAENPWAISRMEQDVVDPRRLRRELTQLRKSLGIEKRLIFHDFRRTTAVQLYRRTGNIRTVQSLLGHHNLQSTFWYLDHDLEPVDRVDLEAIKQPFIAWRKNRTA